MRRVVCERIIAHFSKSTMNAGILSRSATIQAMERHLLANSRRMTMKRFGLLALAALAGAGVASPAFADWDNIGTIAVSYGMDHDTASPDFGGPVQSLRFTAVGGDVQCRTIRATYSNGTSSDLLNGLLRQGQARSADMPGAGRAIRRLDFVCHAFSHSGATIRMDADIGQYRAQWRASPEWSRTWSRFLHWADNNMGAVSAGMSANNWVLIGSAQFNGTSDRDGGAAGQAGRGITELGFKPANGDAVCSRVNVRLASGALRPYKLNDGQPMQRDRMYKLDLPGDVRNVANVMMRCHALGKNAVTINVYGNK
jgi:hypothetical protein